MKIGILTCHRAHNYGALLQAYALKTYLIKCGYEVEFVDHRPDYFIKPNQNIKPKKFRSLTLKEQIMYPKYFFRWFYPLYSMREKRRKNFFRFTNKFLIKDEPSISENEYDVVIYGSDQIWSKFPEIGGYDKIFFGDPVVKAKRRIAYSASMGVVDIEESDIAFLKASLYRFHAIAVREDDLLNALKGLYLPQNIRLCKTLDPVFLLEETDWAKMNSKRLIADNYLLYYDFQSDEEATKIAERVGKLLSLKVITIVGGVYSVEFKKDYLYDAGPLEFISLYQHADFVISTSFHGVAFAILFRKQFYARQYWNTKRVLSLLTAAGIQDRFINSESEINLENKIDYQSVYRLLYKDIRYSKDYLLSAINEND